MGPAGAGSAMKLVNQLLTASHIALTAEALALGQREGIPADLLIDAVTHSAGTSRQFELRAPRMAAGDHTVHATVRTFLKDLDIATAAAQDVGLEASMAAAAAAVFRRAARLGHLDDSDTTLVEAYETAPRPGETDEP
jgi:3-hydroxyisobutyrate dehydrogenase